MGMEGLNPCEDWPAEKAFLLFYIFLCEIVFDYLKESVNKNFTMYFLPFIKYYTFVSKDIGSVIYV